MAMNSSSTGFPDYMNGFQINEQTLLPASSKFPELTNGFNIYDQVSLSHSDQYSSIINDFKFDEPYPNLNFVDNSFFINNIDPVTSNPPISVSFEQDSIADSASFSTSAGTFALPTGLSSGGDSSSDDSETVLQYITQMLSEEDMEEKTCMFYDPLVRKATEESFYDVLVNNHLPSSNLPPAYNGSSDYVFTEGTNGYGESESSISNSKLNSCQRVGDMGDSKSSLLQNSSPGEHILQSNIQHSTQFSAPNPNNTVSFGDAIVNELLARNIFRDSESILQFKKGLEEASKFLPGSDKLNVDVTCTSSTLKEEAPKMADTAGKGEREKSANGLGGKKNHGRENIDIGRRNKQSAVYMDESELSEMFDRVLLYPGGKNQPSLCDDHEATENFEWKKLKPSRELPPQGSTGGKARTKKQGKKQESVDLRTLLTLCAQAVSANDFRTANEILKQIRQHSSLFGDGSERLAHFFANALEARLNGTGSETKIFYASLPPRKAAPEILKAYQVYLSTCPFKKIAIFFANKTILKLAEKAKTLHIVDFGILYGFQWPILIKHLSFLPGGPPKLRITGIELPKPGLYPAERVEETGRRLAKYCERFNVSFEYHPIASESWETIQIDDLKLDKSEVLIVNCMYRFESLLDETVEVNSPRNSVLRLIRKMNPNIFVHSIVNGSYDAPFFIARFREALFHFSLLFDMLESTISHENEERLMFEREFYGREIMNVIACEGLERVERPETYKQWMVRCTRVGFRQLPLDQELVDIFACKLKAWYHKDFVLDQDSHWMLQGWKGRILHASTCWVPT